MCFCCVETWLKPKTFSVQIESNISEVMNYSIEKSSSPLDYESNGIFVTESLVYHD